MLAAHWWGYKVREEFDELDLAYQAHLIAVYRIENQIQAVLQEDARMEAKRQRALEQAHQLQQGR